MEKMEPSCTVDGNVNGYNHYGGQYERALKTKTRTTVLPSNPTTKRIPQENHNSKRSVYILYFAPVASFT